MRQGTWQFISSSLLGDPSKCHEIHDDLESCFWVLLNVSLHYFKHQGVNFSLDMFNEYVAPRNDLPATGGSQKMTFLTNRKLAPAKWECAPLNNLLHELSRILKRYLKARAAHISPDDDSEDEDEKRRFKQKHEELEQVDVILNCFDRALASKDWPTENDAVEDQFEPSTFKQADQSRRNNIAASIATDGKGKSSHLMLTRKRSTSKIQLDSIQSSKRSKITQRTRRDSGHARPLPSTLASVSVPLLRSPPPPPPPTHPVPKRTAANTRANTRTAPKRKPEGRNRPREVDGDVEMQESGPSQPYRLRSSKSREAETRGEANPGPAKKTPKVARPPANPQKNSSIKRGKGKGKGKSAVRMNIPEPAKSDTKGKKSGLNRSSRR